MPLLPTTKIKAEICDPKFLIYFGKPKSGKSSLAALLDNNLIIDLEKGYRSIDAMKVEVNSFNELLEVVKELTEHKTKNGSNKYKYITIDNGTKLEDILLPYASMLYKKTPAGKNFTGDDVRDLPNGSGYRFTRSAMQNIIEKFKELCDTIILICHTKDSIINQQGKEMSEMSIALTGATARIIAADADAIGFMYRKKNQNILNFNGGGDFIVEARQPHLRGKEIVIGESDEAGNITAFWNKIFIDSDTNNKLAA